MYVCVYVCMYVCMYVLKDCKGLVDVVGASRAGMLVCVFVCVCLDV